MYKSMRNRIKRKLKYLGLKFKPEVFIWMRLIGSVILFLFLLFFVDYGYFIAPIVTVLYYILIEFIILDLGIKKRIRSLEEDALGLFPVMMMCLSKGRNVKGAISLSVNIVNSELSNEFIKVLNDVNIGKSLDESLNLLKERIPSSIISNIIISLMEANRLGNNINDSVNIQLGYIKEEKKKKTLLKYKRVPFILAIISIIFVFIILGLMIILNIYS